VKGELLYQSARTRQTPEKKWVSLPLPPLYSPTNSIHNNVFLNLRGRSTKDWAVVSPDASIGDNGADLGDAMFRLQSLHGIQRVFFHRAIKFDSD